LVDEFQGFFSMRRSHGTASIFFEEEGDHAALLGFMRHLHGVGTAAQPHEREKPKRSIEEA
jgi:hypothetical protein